MSAEKASALVLRVVEFSESSCVVTLFTREFGKVRGLAKGARRPKGPFESALDLLSLCRIVFLAKSSDALDLLTEAKLERRFRAAGRDLSSLYAGYYVAELLNDLTTDHDPHPQLFDVACESLAALGVQGAPVASIVVHFELAALRLVGHLPSLDACVECGGPINERERVAFGNLSGGVLCPRCRPGKKQVVSISPSALRTVRAMADERDQSWRSAVVERSVAGEVRGLLNQYVAHLLGRRPKMHAYLKQ